MFKEKKNETKLNDKMSLKREQEIKNTERPLCKY